MTTAATPKLNAVAGFVLAAVLALVPFHALLTVFGASLVGNYDLLRLWKEVLLLGLMPVAAVMIWRTPGSWQRLRSGQLFAGRWLMWAILAYVVLHIGLGLLALAKGQVNSQALLYAWVVNLRPLLIFVLALIIASHSHWLRRHWRPLLLLPAAGVIAFGLLQTFVLPIDYLANFGYSKATIEPYETVDEKLDYIRVQSTMRGSNPLGAYLIVVLGALAVLLRRERNWRHIGGGLLLVGGVAVLAATYSRSAYIGSVVTLLAVLVLAMRSQRQRRWLAVGVALAALVVATAFATLRENDRFENTFFHTNEHSRSADSSNDVRMLALQSGVQDVVTEPFGRGPGTAGPASVHNSGQVRIAENYYLQIGQETGWLGLGLLLSILVMLARRLWRLRSDPLARILLVSLAGISIVNVVQHAWADDTLALVWWGFAGIALAGASARPDIISPRPSAQTTQTKNI